MEILPLCFRYPTQKLNIFNVRTELCTYFVRMKIYRWVNGRPGALTNVTVTSFHYLDANASVWWIASLIYMLFMPEDDKWYELCLCVIEKWWLTFFSVDCSDLFRGSGAYVYDYWLKFWIDRVWWYVVLKKNLFAFGDLTVGLQTT